MKKKKKPDPANRETSSILIDKLIKAYDLETKDIADAVELYYDAQKLRIMHANKERTEGEGELKSWFSHWLAIGEKVISGKLEKWVASDKSPEEAKWARDQWGIGPIIASGLAANIDVERAKSISALWKYAGQAPGYDRKVKGVTLAYNVRLKTLCWKLGESFVKVSGKEDATYGKLYTKFKVEEIDRNNTGRYHKQAEIELRTKMITDSETKKCLESGKLTNGHLHSRAKRRAVKIFLSDYWTVARRARGLIVTEPYAIAILGHDGKINNV